MRKIFIIFTLILSTFIMGCGEHPSNANKVIAKLPVLTPEHCLVTNSNSTVYLTDYFGAVEINKKTGEVTQVTEKTTHEPIDRNAKKYLVANKFYVTDLTNKKRKNKRIIPVKKCLLELQASPFAY